MADKSEARRSKEIPNDLSREEKRIRFLLLASTFFRHSSFVLAKQKTRPSEFSRGARASHLGRIT